MNIVMPKREVLSARGVVKEFGGHRALDGVDFSLRDGQIHALLGQNGAGKSTLIRIFAGVYQATAGDIRVAGKPARIATPHDAKAAGIAVVHQHGNLVPSMSVRENLLLGRTLPRRGGLLVDWARADAMARDILDRVGLDIDPRAPIASLRPDARAMVAIARAISTDAKAIILDEPTATLSPEESRVLFGEMRRLADLGHAFIFVSHRMNEVFDIADSATVLRDGKATWNCDNRAGLTRADVIAAITGRRDHAPKGTPREIHGSRRRADGPVALRIEELAADRVRKVSFAVASGEILGLAGLPESGAEETLDVLFGRRRRHGGQVHLDGRMIDVATPREAIGHGFAFVPKDRLGDAIIAGQCVRANVTVSALDRFLVDPVTRLVRKSAERDAARALAERLSVKSNGIEADIGSLSGGNQQKCVLARWVMAGARVLLLNSPTAAVDVGAKAEIYALLRNLADAGVTVLFTSSELDEFALICDRVLVYRDGRIDGELVGPDIGEAKILDIALGDGRPASARVSNFHGMTIR